MSKPMNALLAWSCLRHWSVGVSVCCLAVVSALSSVRAGERLSASFTMVVDETTAAGGASSSLSFAMLDSAVGQAVDPAPVLSGTFVVYGGIVQVWEPEATLDGYLDYLLGRSPTPPIDLNGDAKIDMSDVIHLINQ